jgi:hypothetical protein
MRIRNIDQLVAFSVQQNVPARQIDIVNQSPQGILESRDNEAAVNEMSVAHPRRSAARYRGRNVRSAGNPRTGAQACGQKGTALAGAEKQVLTRMRVKCPVACPGPLEHVHARGAFRSDAGMTASRRMARPARAGSGRRRCVDGKVLELNLGSRRLGKDFLRLLLKYIHRADVWDWTVADARDAQLGETFIRGHAVHNHNIHR